MLEHDYAVFSEHKLAHQNILKQIQELEGSIRKAVYNEEALDAEELNLIGLLRSWIIDHVLQVDLKMRPLFD
ncbi:MAG: hypothetical protein K1564_14380 [Candidatus Thiodiazotropha sp. (ex. Lucinisca nassula)]|nr:hypothetical protein [Candidatus Thiodiazotropha sp. (ex. Lucinisca nassula)]